ncbi:ECF transporter S component [Floccifex sp.]|uniref:ECF transporter S component n=1 Tax=Floccifex sp. TaxID=2815810 RepID=UPI002A7476FB|nr:ECF transporter S component [Floccifex sp.]MDD7281615.1 ECF transporter S component [Erysipelotrichaceae bacterium]MDY2958478.1 ECF transporter S component [Floccifex sp.]
MNKRNSSVKFMTQLSLLIAVEIVMKLIGLGMVPIGPLKMSFLTVPVAIGAVVLGPSTGAILGFVFGIISFYDALSGASVMTSTFLSISPVHTFILCVVTRTIMGWLVGMIAQGLKKGMKGNARYFIASFFAPFLNTVFFMGYICIAFYNTDYVQALCSSLGATNPLMFVVLLVGLQGLIEVLACTIVGGACSKGIDVVVNK